MKPFYARLARGKGFSVYREEVMTMYERFEEMVGKLSPTLNRITHRLNGHFMFFDHDDLYQEALAHLWIAFEKGRLIDKTDSYILQGCFFHLKNYIRTTMDKAVLTSLSAFIDDGETTLEETIASEGSGDHSEIDEGLLAENEALKGLTGREREVLNLSMDGLTVREIGARLGVSHVMVVKVKARIKMKCAALKN